MDGVPTDRDSMIVMGDETSRGLSVVVYYRRGSPDSGYIDRVVHQKPIASAKQTVRLATDLASIVDCETVYVIGFKPKKDVAH